MEAPLTGPPNRASSPTVPPIAIAAASPTARVSVATAMITSMRNEGEHELPEEACPSEPLMVAATLATSPSEAQERGAATAPASCAAQ